MLCPVCNKEMLKQDFGGVVVDLCTNGCKGIWFDWMELCKLDEQNEGLANAMKEALNSPRVNDENRGKINCPHCRLPMHTHKYESAKEVNVDECYNCGGFFIDSGELRIIRDNFMGEEDRDAYRKKLLDSLPDYKAGQSDIEKQKLRTEAISRFTKFLRLSYYIKGR